MAVKASELRSGIFVVLATIALTILIFSVGNFRARLKPATRFHTYVDNAKFLRTHDPVTYAGFRVGQISAIEVAPERPGMVKISVEVDQSVEVKKDAVLTLKQDGLLGPKYLEVSPGTPGAPKAEGGAELAGVVPVAFVDLGPSFEGPLDRLNTLLKNLNDLLGTSEFRQSITATLNDTRTMLATMNDQLKKFGEVAAKTGDKTQEALAEVQETVKSAREPLTKSLKSADDLAVKLGKDADQISEKLGKSLDELTARLNRSADGLDQLLRDADQLVVTNNRDIYETIRGLRDTSYHLELAAKRIRANPSVVLFGAKETAEELRHADETELRMKGRARRYDKEDPK